MQTQHDLILQSCTSRGRCQIGKSEKEAPRFTHFGPETEPSHKLLDAVCQVAADQTIEWTPWEKLTSRSSEITHSQNNLKLFLDSHGSVKVAAKMKVPDANVTGDMRVKQALNRRARAFDLVQLCSYTTMEAWHERVFEVLQKEPAPNAMAVTRGLSESLLRRP